MDNKRKKFDVLNNIEDLKINHILVDAIEHKEYFYYTSHVNSVENPFSLYFGFISNDPEKNMNANDPKEWDLKKPGYLCFCRCLSYFKNESVAMWKMYADKSDSSDKTKIKNNGGICYRFTKGVISNFEEKVAEIIIIFSEGNEPLTLNLDLKRMMIENKIIFNLHHVLYYDEKYDDEYNLRYFEILRSTHKAKISGELYDKLCINNPMKKMCWSYETEAKLYCYLSNSIFDEIDLKGNSKEKIIGLSIQLNKINKNMMQIRSHPEEDWQEDKSFLNGADVTLESSKLKGCVRFNKKQSEGTNETNKN